MSTGRGGWLELAGEDYFRHLSSLNPYTGERVPEPGRRGLGGDRDGVVTS